MHLNIAICDDSKSDAQALYKMLNTCSFECDIDLHIDLFSNGKDLIEHYNKDNFLQYHVLLLDIEMPSLNGIKTADIIKHTKDYNIIIVFVSNYPEYMHDSFSVHPYHFLQKPVKEDEVNRLISDIISDYNHNHSMIALLDCYDREYTINLKDVYYIDCTNSRAKQLSFYLRDSSIETRGTLSYWKSKLEDGSFISCTRTILVNLNHIHYIKDNRIILDNGNTITVSKRNKKFIIENFLNKVVAVHNNL